LKNGRSKLSGRNFLGVLLFLVAGRLLPVNGAEVDLSKLPPPASKQVDFAQDVKPIFDLSCVRCHGPERPKSGFRLDNREAALKGGHEGPDDIVPGQSAKSRLIHYVAGLDPDTIMPPEGKGDPLTREQVGVLRTWIDEGAAWGTAGPTNIFDVTVSPFVGGTFVKGDNNKFREHYWRTDGADGGVEHFEILKQVDPNTKIQSSGHASVDDYKLNLSVDRTDLGFIHSGWEQYRKYYDDTGGYFPGPDPELPQSLGKDLFLDNGRAWIDFGLTLPNWPRIVLGYEYGYKRGEEATTSWGYNLVPDNPRNIAPNSKHLDERVHIIKLDFDGEFKGVTIQDQFRGEFYSLDTHYTNLAARGSVAQDVSDENHYFQGANSIRLEKRFTSWLFGSGGYFYSKLDADDTFTNATTFDETLYLAAVPNIELGRETHLFNLNALLGPFDGFTISAGAQSEWTRQHGFGTGDLHGIGFIRQFDTTLAVNPATLYSDYDQNTITEMVGLRYTRIPFTALFADARLRQETLGRRDGDIQPDASFVEDATHTSQLSDFRVGFNTSPWERVSLSAHYRRYESDSRYNTNDIPEPVGGYPGFIRWRDQTTDEVESKLVLRLASWLKTTFSYQIVSTDYEQENRPALSEGDPGTIIIPAGYVLAGKNDSHIYSAGMTVTPMRRLALTTTFSYQDTTLKTESADIVPPYKGNVYSALVNALYIINQSTDASISYSFSLGDFSEQFNFSSPPPVGIRYQQHAVRAGISRRINKNMTTRLQYGYYAYDEPSLAGANDYTAHSVFATLVCRLP
jgi:hypothetical protein